jgi:RNA polymerase sigma factor (sigma-70 family)
LSVSTGGDVTLLNMSDTDLELLARYTRHHAEDAFSEIVRRHLDLVHSAALRQVRSPQLAEEVAQSTFIKLARQARQLAPDTILTAWLYQVARRESIDVIRREARRRLREQIASEMNAMHATADDWTQIEPLLDEAMHALNDIDRTAVLLRYFERKPAREMAQTLGISDEAAQKRVRRAVERLREFFAKRGVTVGTNGLVVVISTNAIQAAPVGLSAAIAATAAVAGTTVATTIVVTALQKTFITAAIVAVVGIGVYEAYQASVFRNRVNTLRKQQTALTEQLARERDDTTRQLAALSNENGRLNRDTTELMRLRAEATRLRQELAATPKRPAPPAEPVAAKEAEPTPEPVRSFTASAQATVPAGQTLALGGWSTEPGKRTLVFVKPGIVELSTAGRLGSISLESGFVELTEEVLAKAASDLNLPSLNKLKTDGLESSMHSLFSAEEAERALKTLESNARALHIGAPQIRAADGTIAMVGSMEKKTMNGQEYSVGPSLEVVPRIDADGSSVKLKVTARLNVVNPDSITARTAR